MSRKQPRKIVRNLARARNVKLREERGNAKPTVCVCYGSRKIVCFGGHGEPGDDHNNNNNDDDKGAIETKNKKHSTYPVVYSRSCWSSSGTLHRDASVHRRLSPFRAVSSIDVQRVHRVESVTWTFGRFTSGQAQHYCRTTCPCLPYARQYVCARVCTRLRATRALDVRPYHRLPVWWLEIIFKK